MSGSKAYNLEQNRKLRHEKFCLESYRMGIEDCKNELLFSPMVKMLLKKSKEMVETVMAFYPAKNSVMNVKAKGLQNSIDNTEDKIKNILKGL